jgi:hypothetical protein
MRTETRLFTADVVRTGGTWQDLVTAPRSFVDATLAAAVYAGDILGAPPAGPHQAVDFDPVRRAGVLTHASTLTRWSHPTHIGISRRGLLLRQRLLCQLMPPPPPDVDMQPEDPQDGYDSRHDFQSALVGDPACAACHTLFDPMTFAFDNYDPIGRWQTELTPLGGPAGSGPDTVPVEPHGEVAALEGGGMILPYDDRDELLAIIADAEQAQACVVEQHVRFGLGREIDERDACTIEQLTAAFVAADGGLAELLLDLAESDAFVLARP